MGSPNRSTVHRTKTAPVLMTTNVIENTNVLNSFPAAPPSAIDSANPNFLTPGCPGGYMSLSYLFTSLANLFTPLSPDNERILELTRDVSSHWGRGGLDFSDYMLITLWVLVQSACNVIARYILSTFWMYPQHVSHM